MAEYVERMDGPEEFEYTGFRLSWGAIFAGLVVALVVQILLSMIGLAIGLGAVNFGPGANLGQIGTGAGIWAVLSGLISLFVGGLVAGHLAGVLTRLDGMLHGVLVWGLSVIVALWALSAGATTLLGGMFGAAGQVLASAVGGAGRVGAAAIETQGVPEVPGGDGERRIVAILEQQGLSEQQAQQAAQQIGQVQSQIQLQAERVQQRAPEVAEQVAGTVSSAIWWILLGAVLSLAAAAGGAALTAKG